MQYQHPPVAHAASHDEHLQLLLSHLAGNKRPPPGRPGFAFGMHKGGSTMLHNFMAIACNRSNIRAISASNILFRAGVSDEHYSRNSALLPFFLQHKALFMGFRYVPHFMLNNKDRFLNHRSVVLIRDPRDCVVSAYFSFLKSHVVLAEQTSDSARAIERERERYRDADIDRYCLNEMGRFVNEINGYLYFAHENTRLYRYEDMIFSKRAFFEEVVAYLELDVSAAAFDEAVAAIDIIPAQETPDAHVRNVTPGDHRTKLQAATIEALNHRHADTLRLCGYL